MHLLVKHKLKTIIDLNVLFSLYIKCLSLYVLKNLHMPVFKLPLRYMCILICLQVDMINICNVLSYWPKKNLRVNFV